jgi:hypothetical protein
LLHCDVSVLGVSQFGFAPARREAADLAPS